MCLCVLLCVCLCVLMLVLHCLSLLPIAARSIESLLSESVRVGVGGAAWASHNAGFDLGFRMESVIVREVSAFAFCSLKCCS